MVKGFVTCEAFIEGLTGHAGLKGSTYMSHDICRHPLAVFKQQDRKDKHAFSGRTETGEK